MQQANNEALTLESATRNVSGETELTAPSGAKSVRAQLNVTAASGASPTLDVVVEDTLDGVNFNTIGTFTQVTGPGRREVINITNPFTKNVRIRWTIGGTTPSFTFGVDCYFKLIGEKK